MCLFVCTACCVCMCVFGFMHIVINIRIVCIGQVFSLVYFQI